jgi:hypothetical protein
MEEIRVGFSKGRIETEEYLDIIRKKLECHGKVFGTPAS